MKVSIIIPAFNEEKLLAATLSRVAQARLAFTERDWDSELIVCDNNSTDRTAEIARSYGATVVFEPINQISRARNAGAAAATGDWLLFIDADSRPTAALLSATADAIASDRVLAGGSTVRMDTRHWMISALTFVWNTSSRLAGWMAGSFIFVERRAFEEIGGFSTELFAGEELELARRLRPLARRAGRRIQILHTAPLETSARKFRLYRPREWLKFLARGLLRPHATPRHREACALWYDGRR